MFLPKVEVRRSVELVTKAFPRFGNWEYQNEVDESYAGFTLWGIFVFDNDEDQRRFFVTFGLYDAAWMGHLTIGQHSYYWSSADFGDAHLLDTTACATLEDAVKNLKGLMV